jgi:DNA-directed RNA polymerase specialized sigma24 family protein
VAGDSTRATRAEIDAALREAKWGELHRRLVGFAIWRTKDKERAKDLAQDAIARVLDAQFTAWDPREKDLLHLLMGLVNDALSNKRKLDRIHREIAMATEKKSSREEREVAREVRKKKDGEETVEDAVIARDLRAKGMAMVRERLAQRDDPLATRILDKWEIGVETPAELALALGTPVAEIVRARDRLLFLAQKVAREFAEAGAHADADADADANANANANANADADGSDGEEVA